jgi:hypothetical protein
MPQDTIPTSIFDIKARYTLEWKLHWLFRLALCCEFVGHGAFGVLTKQAWVVYFGIFGIPESWAWKLMPVVGCVDIILGILAQVLPTRAGLLYMGCWGFFAASLRPLAGEGWWEFLERSYNFSVPLLMPWVHSVGTRSPSWFAVITECRASPWPQRRPRSWSSVWDIRSNATFVTRTCCCNTLRNPVHGTDRQDG